MRKSIFSLVPLAALAAPLAFAAPQQPAQQPKQPPAMQQMQQQSSHMEVSDAQLHKFAAAYEDQMKLRSKYTKKMQNAKSKDEKSNIRKNAEKDMKKAIEKHMSVDQYKKIGKAINSDPKLRQRLVKILQADQKKSAPPKPMAA